MPKFTTEITEQFEKAEPVEDDGVLVAHQRVGSAQIRRNGKHVATIGVGVEVPTDYSDAPPSLVIVVKPADAELGYNSATTVEVKGDAARALAELVKLAIPFLEDKHDETKRGKGPYANIFITPGSTPGLAYGDADD